MQHRKKAWTACGKQIVQVKINAMSPNCRDGLVSSSVGFLGPAIFSELNICTSFLKERGLVSEKRPKRKKNQTKTFCREKS